MNGLLGVLVGGGLALALVAGVSGESAETQSETAAEEAPDARAEVVQGHTTAVLMEIDTEIYGA